MSFWPVFSGIAVLFCITACASYPGDFDRFSEPHSSRFLPLLGNWLASRRGELVSDYEWSDDERSLRMSAFHFLGPAGARGKFSSLISELRLTRVLSSQGAVGASEFYYKSLNFPASRSSITIWTRLIDDIKIDISLIRLFIAILARVTDADFLRYENYLSSLSLNYSDVFDLHARISENNLLVSRVSISLASRIESYKYSINKARLEVPDFREFLAHQALSVLRERSLIFEEVLSFYNRMSFVPEEVCLALKVPEFPDYNFSNSGIACEFGRK